MLTRKEIIEYCILTVELFVKYHDITEYEGKKMISEFEKELEEL